MAYCTRCARSFPNDNALKQHRHNSSSHIVCRPCDRDFNTAEARIQHWIHSSDHNYCETCDRFFDDDDDLQEHYTDEHHYCRRCRQMFDYEDDLDDHLDSQHFYCRDCDRFFDSASNYNAHRRSEVHKDRDLECPGCNSFLLFESDRVAHWEAGVCPSGVDRHRVNEAYVALDTGDFVDSTLLGEDSYGSYQAPQPSNVRVTQRMWDGDAWKCPQCSRTFKSQDVLRGHMRGPAHAPRFYRCDPDSSGCNLHFSTLSGLLKHVESEICGVSGSQLDYRLDDLRYNLF